MSNEKPSENPKERMEHKCGNCGGTGQVKCPPGAPRETQQCVKCKGTGWTLGK
jgi:DnaJ-class molecular chaperone